MAFVPFDRKSDKLLVINFSVFVTSVHHIFSDGFLNRFCHFLATGSFTFNIGNKFNLSIYIETGEK